MAKKADKEQSQDDPNFGNPNADNPAQQPADGGALPGEQQPEPEPQFGEAQTDESLFVTLKEPGETFTGMFIRKVEKGGSEELKYPGFLFAEYPGGGLRVLPANWSVGEEIAKREEKGCPVADGTLKPLEGVFMQLTLIETKEKKDDTSVKLYQYRYATAGPAFRSRIRWTEQFQETPSRPGK